MKRLYVSLIALAAAAVLAVAGSAGSQPIRSFHAGASRSATAHDRASRQKAGMFRTGLPAPRRYSHATLPAPSSSAGLALTSIGDVAALHNLAAAAGRPLHLPAGAVARQASDLQARLLGLSNELLLRPTSRRAALAHTLRGYAQLAAAVESQQPLSANARTHLARLDARWHAELRSLGTLFHAHLTAFVPPLATPNIRAPRAGAAARARLYRGTPAPTVYVAPQIRQRTAVQRAPRIRTVQRMTPRLFRSRKGGRARQARRLAPTIRKLSDANTGSVQGAITDSVTSLPLNGVCVYLYQAAGTFAGAGSCTGAAGDYSITGIAAGQYTVAVFDPAGTHPTTWYGNVTSQGAASSFTVSAGAVTSPVNVAVSELAGISGHVRDAVTLGRVEGACVYAKQTSGGSNNYATCLAAGRDTYAITGMAAGDYSVSFVDPAGLRQTTTMTTTVTAGHTTSSVDANMPEITGIIGSLLDAATAQPVVNACVMLYAPGGGYVANSYRCTNSQGQFVIDSITPGNYLLAYYDPQARFNTFWFDGKSDQGSASVVTVNANTITSVGAARVTTFGAATGTVRDAAGNPAANVCVYADDLTGQYTGIGTCSDANGSYTLSGLPTGQYKIAFYPPGTVGTSPYWYLQAANEVAATTISIVGLTTTTLRDEYLTVADDTTPPGPVTNLTATSANTTVHLSWANPTDNDFSGVTIRRAVGNVAPNSPTTGTAVAEVTKPGTTFDDTNVSAGQTYSYAVFAHDATPNYSAAASATITAVATASAQHECGTISASTTWSRSDAPVYVLDCPVIVSPDATLTIQAGAIVKGSSGSGITVEGSLVISGSSGSPVVLTSLRDDSVGGDTNGDGNSTGPASGDWLGVSASPVSGAAAPSVLINRTKVAYSVTALSLDGASVSVRNSTIDHATGDGIDVSSPQGVPTVSGNTVTSASSVAINIQAASLDMGTLDGNSGSGNGLNGVQLGNDTVTVSSSLPWSGTLIPVLYTGCNGLTIAPSVTLTLGAGTIVKGETNGCSYLNVLGSLVASGTAASPVTFTSWRDDSVGGDTNGDGNATGPQKGDWGGITSSPAGNGNPNPTLDLNHLVVKYASTGVSASQTTTSIRNSTVDRVAGDGIDVSAPIGLPTVSGNTVTNASNVAINVQSASLDMGALDGNSGSSNGLNGVQLTNDTVTVSSSLPWSGTLIPVLYSGCYGLTVAPGSTLTLGAGTIVKGETNGCSYLNVQGSLVANGTAASPVTFTSWRDDTVGGDTNGDGSATFAARGDWGGIAASPAGNGNPSPTLDLNHVMVKYASTGVSASQTTTSVRNSTVDHVAGDGIDISSPLGLPTVSGNTVISAATVAIGIQGASVDMAALDGNSGSGNGLNGVQFTNDTVTVNSSLPWTGSLIPVLASGCNGLTVAPNVTLTLGPGTLIKGETNGCSYLSVQGSLVATGTAATPVTFTSWRDDTIGGDTNGDGSATFAARGDWGGVFASPAGNGNPNPTLDLSHVVVKYASTAVSASQTTTSIRNGLFDHSAGDGIDVTSPVGVPTVSGNTVASSLSVAINIQGASLDMGALDGNSGSGNGLNGVQLANDTVTVSSSLPWTGTLIPVLASGCNGLTVAPNVTLTLGAGTIVKGETTGCSYLGVEGSLVATGTAASPVTFTSWRDDTVGGDTNGDGNATLPARGDWGGIYASPAGNGNPNPTLDLNHLVVKYASTAISTNQTETSIRNSTFDHVDGEGIAIAGPIGIPTVSGNTVTSASGVAIEISSASLDMGALDGNSGSGNGLNGVQLGNDTVTVSSSLPWSGTLIPVIYGGCSALTVAPSVTLTLGAGTVMKGNGSCAYLSVQGTLNANGTAVAPVTLTSWRDDSVGGDTNADGNATSPAAGDWGGLIASPAGNGNPDPTLNLNHVVVEYAQTGVQATQSSTSVRNSTVAHMAGDGIDVSSPDGVPTVIGNTVTNTSSVAINVQSASIDMAALDGNSGSSNGLNGVQLTNDVVTVSSSLPWSGTLIPVIYSGCNALTIASDATLTLNAGAVVKGDGSCAYISVEGTLAANGTANDPVTFTSSRDASVGGDTKSGTPAAGDWGGISVAETGSAELNGTTLRYATTALQVNDGGDATIHGAILQSTAGVQASTFVDATNVDWGDPSGPAPIGSGTSISGGGVLANPWVGYQLPPDPPPPDGPATSFPALATPNCVLFVGVRGSGDWPQNGAPYDSDYPERDFGDVIQTVFHDYRDQLSARGFDVSDSVLQRAALDYPAVSATNPLNYLDGVFIYSYERGVYELLRLLQDHSSDCGGNEKFILAGYSQGALVIRLALGLLSEVSGVDDSRILAVLLVADPAFRGSGAEIHIGGDEVAAANAQGVYERAIQGSQFGMALRFGLTGLVEHALMVKLGLVQDGAPPVPSGLAGRTESLCYNHDAVCAPGRGASFSIHTSYSSDQYGDLETLGTFAADMVPSN